MQVGSMETNDQQHFYFQHSVPNPSANIIYPSNSGPTNLVGVVIGTGAPSPIASHVSLAQSAMGGGVLPQTPPLQNSPSTTPAAKKRRPKKTPASSTSCSPKSSTPQLQLLNTGDMTAAPTELTLLVQQAMYPTLPDAYTPPPPPPALSSPQSRVRPPVSSYQAQSSHSANSTQFVVQQANMSSNYQMNPPSVSISSGQFMTQQVNSSSVSTGSAQFMTPSSSASSNYPVMSSSATNSTQFMVQSSSIPSYLPPSASTASTQFMVQSSGASTRYLNSSASTGTTQFMIHAPSGLLVSSDQTQTIPSQAMAAPASSGYHSNWSVPASPLVRSNSSIDYPFTSSNCTSIAGSTHSSPTFSRSLSLTNNTVLANNSDFVPTTFVSQVNISHSDSSIVKDSMYSVPFESRSHDPFVSQDCSVDPLCDESAYLAHTPSSNPTAPSPQPSKTKMDMEKLDDTIDLVMQMVHSDLPHEDVFVLPPRCREAFIKVDNDPLERPPSSPPTFCSPSDSPITQPSPVPQSVTPNSTGLIQQPGIQQHILSDRPTMTNYLVEQMPSQGQTIIATVPQNANQQRSVMTTHLQLPQQLNNQANPNMPQTVYIQQPQQRADGLIQSPQFQSQQVLLQQPTQHRIYIPSSSALVQQQRLQTGPILAQRQLFTLTQNNQMQQLTPTSQTPTGILTHHQPVQAVQFQQQLLHQPISSNTSIDNKPMIVHQPQMIQTQQMQPPHQPAQQHPMQHLQTAQHTPMVQQMQQHMPIVQQIQQHMPHQQIQQQHLPASSQQTMVIQNQSLVNVQQSEMNRSSMTNTQILNKTSSSDPSSSNSVLTVTSSGAPQFVHPNVPTSAVGTLNVSVISSPSPGISSVPSPVDGSNANKKRQNPSSKASATKRRKPNSAAAVQAEQKQINLAQKAFTEMVDNLKVSSIGNLIHQPEIRAYTMVLPPAGNTYEMKEKWATYEDEETWLDGKCLKYKRYPFLPKYPKPEISFIESEHDQTITSENLDQIQKNENIFISQHLPSTIPDGPMLHVSMSSKLIDTEAPLSPVCSSPVTHSFEDNMTLLLSNKERGEPSSSGRGPPILRMLYSADGADGNGDRSSPPLAMFHLPHPDLLQRINVNLDRGSIAPLEVTPSTDKETSLETGVTSTVQLTINGATQSDSSPQGGGGSGSSPLVDSETGEILGVRRSSSQLVTDASMDLGSVESNVDLTKEKLHLTFTLSPKSADNVQKMVKNITDLLGINYRSVNYQVTRTDHNTEVIVDQKNAIMPQKFIELEQQLRDQFAPLSLRLQKDTEHGWVDSLTPNNVSIPTPTGSSSIRPATSFSSPSVPLVPSKHEEETVNITTLRSSGKEATECRHCEAPIRFNTGVTRKLNELQTDRGLFFKSDSELDEISFCCSTCMNQFVQCLAETDQAFQRAKDDCYSPNYDPTSGPTKEVIEFRQNFFNAPVVLQGPPPRYRNQFKRQNSALDKSRSRRKGDAKTMFKRWKGIRWRHFSAVNHTPAKKKLVLTDEEALDLLQKQSGAIKLPESSDARVCSLCHVKGDAAEDGPGRLLCFDINKYLHLNCALWCFDVYETVGGSLNSVDTCYERALKTMCSYCGLYGAGLPCYNPRCSVVYHLPCAQAAGCMFFTDRGMYCQLHQPKEHHMQLKSLAVNRRVYINRDENKQVGSVIHDEEQRYRVRIGSLILHSVGQLLPHQIDRGTFHTIRFIFPVGLRTTRVYWSYRRPSERCFYRCSIRDREGSPEFCITADEIDLPKEEFVSSTCNGVWQIILSKIEKLRIEHNLVRVFPQHLQGEKMFGLTEPHIVRAIESLPGVESLKDYAFKFGRLQLIEEMPLAINPTGCARSEPKMRTYLRRLHLAQAGTSSSGRHFLPVTIAESNGEQTPYSKQYISSRSQQYRRLKTDAKSNVILGRSRIQGLGLFAVREMEKYTMVIEYIGELIRLEVANRREKEYEEHNRGIYMFRLDDHQIVDATVTGGLARYINHSCQPNCVAEVVTFERESHIMIVANKRIEAGEELTYDYKFDLEDGGIRLPCLCGASGCRKWMN